MKDMYWLMVRYNDHVLTNIHIGKLISESDKNRDKRLDQNELQLLLEVCQTVSPKLSKLPMEHTESSSH